MNKKVLLEIGLEELPARFIDNALQQLLHKTKEWLAEHRIMYKSIDSFSTPRRLAIMIHDVPEQQSTLKEEIRGPSKKIAQNEDGTWSKAAIGFSKGQGQHLDDLYIKEVNGTEYIFIRKVTKGKKTIDVLPEMKSIITAIQFPQTMYWDKDIISYARPIRWLVALFGEEIIPFEIAKVKSDRWTYGHRFLGSRITINNANDYEQLLEENYVIPNVSKREQLIIEGIKEIEAKNTFNVLLNRTLLNEVRNLVEYPTVFSGKYDSSFLQLPKEVLITTMEEHQRYFSVESKNGDLLPYFVSVRNGDENEIETVVKGNEKVLEARLSDAQFFYDEDQKQSIEFYLNKLKSVIFQEKLGTYDEKVKRTVHIAKSISEQLLLDQQTTEHLIRAAEISKFDLVTQMVNEFPELQGVIGEKYALSKEESKEVAVAIREHYLPLRANGELPQSTIGAVLSVSDKLDTIVGCIIVGLTPTGSQDPYGLRRQAIGVLRILRENKWNISLEWLLNITLEAFGKTKINKKELIQFFRLRAQHILSEANIEPDVVKSVLSKEIGHILYTVDKAKLLSTKRNDLSFKPVEEALVRVLNLAKQAKDLHVNEELFQTDSEQELFEQFNRISNDYYEATEQLNANKALDYLSMLANPINNFFDHNMVMDDNEQIRSNRLALLKNIAKMIDHYADLTEIQWKQKT